MKVYKSQLSLSYNRKGVLDIDTVKGCTFGTKKYPNGGCYGLCYAFKIAKLYGYDFTKSISRKINFYDCNMIIKRLRKHKFWWFRIGTMGDPCHDWELTLKVCNWLNRIRIPIIVTKHWIEIPETFLYEFKKCNIIINTSISALDTAKERKYRLYQYNRVKDFGIYSVLRVVSCKFGNTKKGKQLRCIQDKLFKNNNIIDNPLRIPRIDKRVISGDIIVNYYEDMFPKQWTSKFNNNTYIGNCENCPDQCGYSFFKKKIGDFDLW